MRWLNLLIGLVLVPLLLSGCAEPGPPNVVLISIDTLRADHLGYQGYSRDVSPNIDRLARDAVVFTNAFAPAPRTFPSHVNMLTGVHPYRIGISRRGRERSIPDSTPILSEILQAQGYQTAAWVDSASTGWLSPERGFGRGFDDYNLAPHRDRGHYIYDVGGTVDAALDWLDGRDPERPFFLFVHTKSVHDVRADLPRPDGRYFPYEAPDEHRLRFMPEEGSDFTWSSPRLGVGSLYLEELNKLYWLGRRDPANFPPHLLEVLKALYDAGIYYTDEQLGRFFDALEEQGLMGETLVVVTSDHGEAFLEHGFFKHGTTVYKEMLHVPLLFREPGGSERRRLPAPASIGDIPPTVLDLLGLPIPEAMDGLPLFSASAAALERRGLYAFVKHRNFPAVGMSVRRGDWKLVYDRLRRGGGFEVKLYNLAEDPEERHPVEGEVKRAGLLLQELMAWRDLEEIDVGEEVEMDEETLEHLRAVGYIK